MDEGNAEDVLIELDARRRASLGKLGRHNRYLARESSDGTITLTPAVVISEQEMRLHRDRPDLVERFRDAEAHPERQVGRPERPSRQSAAS